MSTQHKIATTTLEEGFAQKIVFRLSESENLLDRDVSERLKAARAMALSKRKILSIQSTEMKNSGSSLVLGGFRKHPRWDFFASVLPLVALIVGLLVIGPLQDQSRADEVAEVDTELLIDELPPEAYTDPGFLQYLRSNSANSNL